MGKTIVLHVGRENCTFLISSLQIYNRDFKIYDATATKTSQMLHI